jgi:hypothetical protein
VINRGKASEGFEPRGKDARSSSRDAVAPGLCCDSTIARQEAREEHVCSESDVGKK